MKVVRIRRLLLWIALPLALLVLLYAGLGFLAVPHVLRSSARDYVSQHYRRALSLGDIRFNPFTLQLDISDLSLPDADGQPMIGFRHLMVNLTVASLWRLGPDFQAIVLQQPFARILIRPDGSLNLKDLAPPAAPGEQPKPSSGPGRLFISHFSVQGGNVAFEDRAHPSAFRAQITPIDFDLRNFSTVGREGGTYSLSATSQAGERFNWAGSLTAAPLSSHGQFEVANLQAHTLWNYVRDSVHFDLPSGSLSLQGDYDFTAATNPAGLAVNVHEMTLANLSVRPKGGSDDYVRVDKLEVHETRVDLAKRSVTVGSVQVAGGNVRAWVQKPGTVNLLELAGPPQASSATAAPSGEPAAPASAGVSAGGATPGTPGTPVTAVTPATAPAPATAEPWTVSVPDIALEGLKISAEDRQVSPATTVVLDGLSVHLRGLALPRTSPLTATISTQVNKQGKLDLQAQIQPDSAVKVHAELARLDLTALQPYIARQTDMTLRSGLLSAKLDVERAADAELMASGDAELSKFNTVDNALKRDFIKFERLQFSGIDFKSKPRSLHVHTITARAPYARVIIESDRTVNVAKVLRLKSASQPSDAAADPPPGAAASSTPSEAHRPPKHASRADPPGPSAPADAPSAQSEMAIAIDAVKIEDGSANYADFWIQPHFAVGIQTLHGTITGLKSDPRARAKVELQGKVDRYAPVHIWGVVNPLAATAYSDINLSFKGVELSTVTPYSGHFAGYKIEKGKLSVDIGYKIENRQLSAQHRFVIDQLELGDRVESPDAVKLPLKIAVALLKDRNGVIDVDLPVTGSLDNPQFRLGPLIWKAVLGLLTKVATAPFAALGHLFGGGAEMKYVDFGPGSAALEPAEHDKLATLAKALKEKTQLELDIPVTYSGDLDKPALASARLDRELLALNEQTAGRGHGRSSRKGEPEAAAQHAGSGTSEQNPDESAAAARSDPALTDPASRFRLLVDLYRQELGKGTALPDSAQTIVALKKKDPPPDYEAASAQLETALLPRINVSDAQLEGLGKRRAQAIQDVLLGGGELDPARVFIIGSAPKNELKDKVRVELSLK